MLPRTPRAGQPLGRPAQRRPAALHQCRGWLSHGYRYVPVPAELRHLSAGATQLGEHRLVMAVVLDRALEEDEVVHHRNGDRTDNRPGNLEPWNTGQPKGQRVQDKIDWA